MTESCSRSCGCSQITTVSSCPHSNTSLWEQRNVTGKVKELLELIAAFQILIIFIQFLCEAEKVDFYLRQAGLFISALQEAIGVI